MSSIGIEVQDKVAVLTLDNPPLNVVSLKLCAEMDRALVELAGRSDLRAVIVTGAGGKAFCAGSDIKEFEDYMSPGAVVEKKLAPENAMYSRLAHFPLPTIAALNGHALGGGLELAVCCDLLVAEEGIKLALPEVKLGVFPGSGGTVRVTRRVGQTRALEMMYLGEPLDCRTALDWGLINRVVPRGEALSAAKGLAQALRQRSGSAQRLLKQALAAALDKDEDAALATMLPLIDQAFVLPDCREGVRAFLAKETPRFAGSPAAED